jgi:CheY-like chemotaxis protein
VKDGVALLEHTTFQRIQLEIDLAEDLRPIQGDPSALSHVIMNLCVNAVDAMESGGTLRLTTRNEPPDALVLEVADTGCGMSKEVLDRAFDPFFTTKAQGKGTGLGLPIVYSTIKAHGGTLDIESSPGSGTTIRIHLPACEPLRKEAFPEPSAKGVHRSLQVLVVDDDDLVRTSLELMAKTCRHQSIGVASGEEALQKLQEGLAVDVVILDMNMPGLGGEATLPLLRQLRPGLPVLLATGRVDQRVLDLVDQNAGVSLLSKPFTLEEVRRRIEDLTQG